MLQIFKAETTFHYEQTRNLFTAYAESLGLDLEFQGFTRELATLPGAYAPPAGCILLAEKRKNLWDASHSANLMKRFVK